MAEDSLSKLDDKGVFTIVKVENVEKKVGKEMITEINIETEEEFDGIITVDINTTIDKIWLHAKVSSEFSLLIRNGKERSSSSGLRWECKFNTVRSSAIIGKSYAVGR